MNAAARRPGAAVAPGAEVPFSQRVFPTGELPETSNVYETMKRQKYPYWRPLEGGWAFYTMPRRYAATCMRTASGQWRVPHLNHAGPFDELEDAKRLVETAWAEYERTVPAAAEEDKRRAARLWELYTKAFEGLLALHCCIRAEDYATEGDRELESAQRIAHAAMTLALCAAHKFENHEKRIHGSRKEKSAISTPFAALGKHGWFSISAQRLPPGKISAPGKQLPPARSCTSTAR